MVEKGTLMVNGHAVPAERDEGGVVRTGPEVVRRAAKTSAVAVLSVDRSPMNAKRWLLTLACGHGVWITSERKPSRKTARCSACASTEQP
jgi:hypothetical protein